MPIGKLEAFVAQTEKLLQKPRAIESFIQQQALTDAANQQRNARFSAAMTPPQANAPFYLGRPAQPDTEEALTKRLVEAGASFPEAIAMARAPSEISKTKAEIAGMGLPKPLSAADALAREKFELEKTTMGQPKPLSPADQLAREKFEREKVVDAALDKENKDKQTAQASYFKEKTVNTVSNIDRLIKLYQAGYGGGITGIKSVGQAISFLPLNQGQTAIANTLLDSIKASLSLEEINRMKAFSKTGATGFGSLSDKEGAKTESNITTLDPTLPREEIINRLKQVKRTLNAFGNPSVEPLVIKKVTEIN
jgi:hypothetical protein